MQLKPRLLLWLLRPISRTILFQCCICGIAFGWVLLEERLLFQCNFFPYIFILFHCLVIVGWVSPMRKNVRFLYDSRYDRDTIWINIVGSIMLSVLIVWIPTSLIVWSGLRSMMQDIVFTNSDYPIREVRDNICPIYWLITYFIILPFFHYAWIRKRQSSQDRHSGYLLAMGMVVIIMISSFNWPNLDTRFSTIMSFILSIASVAISIGSFVMHRSTEIK